MLTKVWAVAAIVTLAIAVEAQTSRGTITGTIADPSGAVVIGASIVLTRFETGLRRSAKSNEAAR